MNKIIVGLDEAGRGPLAGRVYASCVILPKDINIEGLNDSKKLSEKQRLKLFDIIISKSIDYAIDYATEEEIDKINILNATFLAMERAICKIKTKFDYVLVDGNIYPFKNIYNGEAVVNGDSIHKEIMAASILAKVSRDKYIYEISKLYPHYNFEKHKGYPTKLHKDMIKKYGVLPIHRKTFKGVKEYIIQNTLSR